MNKSGLTAQSDQLSIIPVRVSVGIMVRVQLVSCPCIYFLQVLTVLLMVMLQVAVRNAAPDPPLHPSTLVHHLPSAHKRVERQGTNSPLFFDQPSCTASVVENSPAGTEVVTVQPHANDEPLSGELTYSLQQGGSARYFSVDSSTGVVTTRGNLPTHTTPQSIVAAVVLHGLFGVMQQMFVGVQGSNLCHCPWSVVGLLKAISTLGLRWRVIRTLLEKLICWNVR